MRLRPIYCDIRPEHLALTPPATPAPPTPAPPMPAPPVVPRSRPGWLQGGVIGALGLVLAGAQLTWASPPLPQDTAEVQPVNFQTEVAPILAAKCYSCHGPDREEGGIRIDQAETFDGYLSAGSLEDSALWTENLAEDAGNPMPPEDHNDPLTTEQRDVLARWILTTAEWETVDDWAGLVTAGDEAKSAEDITSVLWILSGRLHPAVLHFPIALLSVAALFAVFSFGNEHMNKAAIYCLFLGTLGAWVAAITGWGFAEFRNWGEPENDELFSMKSLHRWGGAAVAIFGTLVFLVAWYSRSRTNGSALWWKFGVVILAAMVGFVGHIGGKVHYGMDLYKEPLERLRELVTEAATNSADTLPESTDESTEESNEETTEETTEESNTDSTEAGAQSSQAAESAASEADKSEADKSETDKSETGQSTDAPPVDAAKVEVQETEATERSAEEAGQESGGGQAGSEEGGAETTEGGGLN